jgi:hypothetical protein
MPGYQTAQLDVPIAINSGIQQGNHALAALLDAYPSAIPKHIVLQRLHILNAYN